MNFLAKIFVVLVTILTVALVAMTVAFVAKTENFRERFEGEQAARAAADRAAAQLTADLQLMQGREAEQFAELRNQIQTLESELTRAQSDRARVEADLLTERSRLQQATTQVTGFQSAVQQAVAINQALSEELEQRREESARQATRVIEMADRINELVATVDTLNRETRRLREQLASTQSQLEEVQQRALAGGVDLAAGTAADMPFDFPDGQIRGEVTDVRRVGEDYFASINLGSDDQVARNMRFQVHSGNQYVGTLVVTNVQPKSAAGRITQLKSRSRPPRSGDEVFSGTFR